MRGVKGRKKIRGVTNPLGERGKRGPLGWGRCGGGEIAQKETEKKIGKCTDNQRTSECEDRTICGWDRKATRCGKPHGFISVSIDKQFQRKGCNVRTKKRVEGK